MLKIREGITPEGIHLISSLVRKARENPFFGYRKAVKGVFGIAVIHGKLPGNILERLFKRIDKMPYR